MQTQILYTGRLMGYFRAPDVQTGNPTPADNECGNVNLRTWSPEAQAFDEARQSARDSILVGTGDNFAPRYEARTFSPSPDPLPVPAKPNGDSFKPAGKDQYFWYPDGVPQQDTIDGQVVPAGKWLRSEVVDRMPNFDRFLQKGNGSIPADNVACFLIREKYTAVVPGRHDFYFGPERLRDLARYLASHRIGDSPPVQMLAENLTIDTTWKDDHKPLPDDESRLKFVPHWPTKFDTPSDLAFLSPVSPAGGKVYPWLPGATVKLMPLDSTLYELIYDQNGTHPQTDLQLARFLDTLSTDPHCLSDSKCPADLDKLKKSVDAFHRGSDKVHLCQSVKPGDPDAIPVDSASPCMITSLNPFVWLDRNAINFLFEFPQVLQPNENYGLCLTGTNLPPINGNAKSYCLRFSVYQPLFSSLPPELSALDPKPYVWVDADPLDVAIFGVIDQSVPGYVGALNLQWQNFDARRNRTGFKTTATVQDPAEAIRETLTASNWAYQKQHGKRFEGLKILLSEMGPQRAQALAAHLGGFDVVVTAADPLLASGLHDTTYTWAPAKSFPRDYPAILAVPKSYDPSLFTQDEPVPISSLHISVDRSLKSSWTIGSSMLRANPIPQRPPNVPLFWNAVNLALKNHCHVAGPFSPDAQAIETLAMCAMQKKLGADVVLVQERDFYTDIPGAVQDADSAPDAAQKILDRMIWKGDFLTPINVPGSALVKALQQSAQYSADDKSALSISDEQRRSLVYAGVRHDPDRDEYLINDVPINNDRLYIVATSDYIGGGDTGYPDLAAANVTPSRTIREFPSQLDTISSVVCQTLEPYLPGSRCQSSLKRDAYFDAIEMSPSDSRQGQTSAQQFHEWIDPLPTRAVPGETATPTPATQLDNAVQQRGLGALRVNPSNPSLLAINNASFGFASVNHKFSDAELKNLFPGSPVTQLTTARSHALQFDLPARYSYSWERLELFQAEEVRYSAQYTGQPNAARIINQKQNLWSTDTGVALHVRNRRLPHLEPIFTLHTETQLWNPLPNFIESLAASGKPPVAQPFDLSRTYFLLPRAGIRSVGQVSWFEVGFEGGGELNAVRLVPNPASANQLLLKRPNIRVNGVYWNWHTVVPLSSKVSWQIDEDGDYFLNTRGDNTIDTRFRSDSDTAVNFKVWPSLSFAPTYEIFLYSNKVQGIWFWQGQASLKMNVRVDFWNHREWTKEIQSPSK